MGGDFFSSKTMTLRITAKASQKWFTDKVDVLEWPIQSPDLNPTENLWLDLKRAVHTRSPQNLAEFEQFCKEEWSKVVVSRCASLIETYQHRLQPKGEIYEILTEGGEYS